MEEVAGVIKLVEQFHINLKIDFRRHPAQALTHLIPVIVLTGKFLKSILI